MTVDKPRWFDPRITWGYIGKIIATVAFGGWIVLQWGSNINYKQAQLMNGQTSLMEKLDQQEKMSDDHLAAEDQKLQVEIATLQSRVTAIETSRANNATLAQQTRASVAALQEKTDETYDSIKELRSFILSQYKR